MQNAVFSTVYMEEIQLPLVVVLLLINQATYRTYVRRPLTRTHFVVFGRFPLPSAIVALSWMVRHIRSDMRPCHFVAHKFRIDPIKHLVVIICDGKDGGMRYVLLLELPIIIVSKNLVKKILFSVPPFCFRSDLIAAASRTLALALVLTLSKIQEKHRS
jgi:hypothetical protein